MKLRKRKQSHQVQAMTLEEVIDVGEGLLAQQRHEEFFKFAGQAVELFPESGRAHLLYAIGAQEFRPAVAIDEARQAVRLAPDDPALLFHAAHCLLTMQEPAEARALAIRCREIAPEDFLFNAGLVNLEGCIAALEGNTALAAERLKLAVHLQPDDQIFVRDLAVFLFDEDPLLALPVIDQGIKAAAGDAAKIAYLQEWRGRLLGWFDERSTALVSDNAGTVRPRESMNALYSHRA